MTNVQIERQSLQDHLVRCGTERHHPEREGQDQGQGGHPARAAASDFRGQTARGRTHALGLQHPKGVHAAPGAAPARRKVSEIKDFESSSANLRL